MIDRAEIEAVAEQLEIHTSHVQRDYVHGWLLSELFAGTELSDSLVLKGGNGLRKGYFTAGRYSRDLDFSSPSAMDPGKLRESLNAICSRVRDKAGVEFVLERTRTGEKRGADSAKRVSEARVYFQDFYGIESELILGVRMDVTEFDRLHLPVQSRNLIHPYSDWEQCSRPIRCAKLEEMLATKLRCLLQRKHIADLYDLAFPLLLGRDLDIDRGELLRTFFRITIFGASPGVAKGLLVDLRLEGLSRFWDRYIATPIASRFSFDSAKQTLRQLVDQLLPGPPIRDRSPILFPAALRNPIMEAAERLVLLRLRYAGVERLVEPYSLSFKTRRDGVSREYLYAYDTTGGNSQPGIKAFVPDRVESLEVTDQGYDPRYEVELSKAGGVEAASRFTDSPAPARRSRRRRTATSPAPYTLQCPICMRRFRRKRRDSRLRPHKDRFGNRCYGKRGHWV